MKVKVKVKHLVIGTLVGLLLFLGSAYFFQPLIQKAIIDWQITNGNIEAGKQRILEQLDNDHFTKMELIRDHMIRDSSIGRYYDIYIGPGMTSWSTEEHNLFTLEESVPYLHDYITNAPVEDYSILQAAESLATYYHRIGDFENADSAILTAMSRMTDESVYYDEFQLLRMENAVSFHENELALNMINEYRRTANMTDSMDALMKLLLLEAELRMNDGRLEEALALLNKEMPKLEDWHEQFLTEMELKGPIDEWTGSPYFYTVSRLRDQLAVMLEQGSAVSVVEGKVTNSLGEPLANVGVFLREEDMVNQTVGEEERYQTVTDSGGRYSFTGVFPGSYQLTIGLMFEQAEGFVWPVEMDDWIDTTPGETVEYSVVLTPLIEVIEPIEEEEIREKEMTFAWEAVPGAASYQLYLETVFDGYSFSSPFLSNIDRTEVTVPVEMLYDKQMGVIFDGEEGEENTFRPESILAFTNVDGTFSWYVHAYDKEGKLIAQSNGYRFRKKTETPQPYFHLKEREMTEADRLLMKGESAEAYHLYKEAVEKNSNDKHSLRMLTRLRGFEEKRDEETLTYLLALANLSPGRETLEQIADYYYGQQEWGEFAVWYGKYLAAEGGGDPTDYFKGRYAVALAHLGQLQEAKDMLYEVMEADRSHNFVGYLIAIEYYLNEQLDPAAKVAEKYKERDYGGSRPRNWTKLMEDLHGLEHDSVKEALTYYFSDQEAALTDYLQEKNEAALTNFIEALKNVN
ncbi:Carboxypeptidase regulatory-like domain-containing protein [Evansella caseinilytica]|uniref:Carboxypeptidase regulatory-like domain-containing protein n=1 Tax=Evansella caseinilytica TaxID=1503961 RepID=A0A1H3UYZ0_9BACI|nr:carboxypeptidase-like regulatory domain-containing protein [Evansella caseinilytica]SDZ67548.1 Carboxypeptidase regulatory-like domain-containing protein [Evansella caseinilytica]